MYGVSFGDYMLSSLSTCWREVKIQLKQWNDRLQSQCMVSYLRGYYHCSFSSPCRWQFVPIPAVNRPLTPKTPQVVPITGFTFAWMSESIWILMIILIIVVDHYNNCLNCLWISPNRVSPKHHSSISKTAFQVVAIHQSHRNRRSGCNNQSGNAILRAHSRCSYRDSNRFVLI